MTASLRLFLLCVGAVAVLAGPYTVVRLGGGGTAPQAEGARAAETVSLAKEIKARVWETAALAAADADDVPGSSLILREGVARLASKTGQKELLGLADHFTSLLTRNDQTAAAPAPADSEKADGLRLKVLDQLALADKALFDYREALLHQLATIAPDPIIATRVQMGLELAVEMLLRHRELGGKLTAVMLPEGPADLQRQLPEDIAAYEELIRTNLKEGLSLHPSAQQRKALLESNTVIGDLLDLVKGQVERLAWKGTRAENGERGALLESARVLADALDAAVAKERSAVLQPTAGGGLMIDVVFAMAAVLLVVLMLLGGGASRKQ